MKRVELNFSLLAFSTRSFRTQHSYSLSLPRRPTRVSVLARVGGDRWRTPKKQEVGVRLECSSVFCTWHRNSPRLRVGSIKYLLVLRRAGKTLRMVPSLKECFIPINLRAMNCRLVSRANCTCSQTRAGSHTHQESRKQRRGRGVPIQRRRQAVIGDLTDWQHRSLAWKYQHNSILSETRPQSHTPTTLNCITMPGPIVLCLVPVSLRDFLTSIFGVRRPDKQYIGGGGTFRGGEEPLQEHKIRNRPHSKYHSRLQGDSAPLNQT